MLFLALACILSVPIRAIRESLPVESTNLHSRPSNTLPPHPPTEVYLYPNPLALIQSHSWFSIVLIGLAVRPVVVLLHLLGHAIVAIATTHQKTSIYLGSFGDQEKSAKVRVGLLEIWFTVSPFLWQSGLCVPTDKMMMKSDQKLSYTLAGPMLPVVISGVVLLGSAVSGFSEYTLFILMIFFGLSVFDLFVNFIPNSKPLAVINNRPLFNDGYSLKLLLTQKGYPTEFFVGVDKFSKHEYASAAKHFEKAARIMPGKKNIYDLYMKAKELAS